NTSDAHAHEEWPGQIRSGRRGSASRLRHIEDYHCRARPGRGGAMNGPRIKLDIHLTREKLTVLGLGHATCALEGPLFEAVAE
ncbi:hypothetical protein, partial [Paracoccus liaowanqingii]|uniref:hypothetical protein n=1 Tax=Paracoccus liaowanqingii TaxID=2560053 RepID=UPI0019808E2D